MQHTLHIAVRWQTKFQLLQIFTRKLHVAEQWLQFLPACSFLLTMVMALIFTLEAS
jgi:hypothetical protein